MLFIKNTLLLILLVFNAPRDNMRPHVVAYIDTYKYIAIDEMVRSGIPASITLAQAIIESNAGISSLAKSSNNHFGIKCKSYWTGSAHYYPDDDRDANGKLIPSCFRKYDSVRASYADHSDFLMRTPHYQPLFAYDKTDYELWAKGLELCGYASDPHYAEKLINTIRMYKLDEFDYYTIIYVDPATLNTPEDIGAGKP